MQITKTRRKIVVHRTAAPARRRPPIRRRQPTVRNKPPVIRKKIISNVVKKGTPCVVSPNATVYLAPHDGLGDGITMIGGVKMLSNYYQKVYMLCQEKYLSNLKLLYWNINVEFIPIKVQHHKYFYHHCRNYISRGVLRGDVLACMYQQPGIKPKITNGKLLAHVKNNKKYKIPEKWGHIERFYNDIHLDLTAYYELFDIPSSAESQQAYELVKSYKIVFAHTVARNSTINLREMFQKWVNQSEWFVVCADTNFYPKDHPKFTIAEKLVGNPVAHYIDIIKAAEEIHVIDSCFSCIVHPLHVTGRLKCANLNIYAR